MIRGRRAATLVEVMVFGAVASLVVVALVGLVTKGGKIVELARRTSSSATDMKIVLETLAEDAAELVYLENSGQPYDSSAGGSTFSFVVRSSRVESGLSGGAGLRRIEYRLEGTEKLKDCVRAVTMLSGSGPAGSPVPHTLVKGGVASLKIWPVAAVAQGGAYVLANGNADEAKKGGATVACLIVELKAGEEVPAGTAMENQTVTQLTTKLWCRNRVLELSRGALK